MELSKRLKCIADCVVQTERLADIGTDHAYLPIYLIKNNIATEVIAMDINKGPLEKAKENIKRNRVENNITTRLSNGLQKLSPGEVNTIVIAGMGGMLTKKILEDSQQVVEKLDQMILQPQLDYEAVRKTIHHMNFKIVEEAMIKEEGKYYVIISCLKGVESYDNQAFYKYGKCLIERKDIVLKEYLERQLIKLMQVENQLRDKKTEATETRLKELVLEIKELKEVIGWL